MKASSALRKIQSAVHLGPVKWYFTSTAVRFGVAKDRDGKHWSLTMDKVRNEFRSRIGVPEHFSPTPKLARGLRTALAALA